MNVVLISTYDLGHQPFGLASPAAWLKRRDASVTCLDLTVEPLQVETIKAAHLVAFYLPMHTATQRAVHLIRPVQELNPRAHLCAYGLYAPLNADYLKKLGIETLLGGEFEEGLVQLYKILEPWSSKCTQPLETSFPTISTTRQRFLTPDRSDLPSLSNYPHLHREPGVRQLVGYTEASRGCQHHCRHCPIVPVYQGHFRVVQRDVVLEDIRKQVEGGAEHITFGDPDFFNGLGHSLEIVRSLHQTHPELSYDVTIKIEHLLRHTSHLGTLRDTGCLFITSAVESLNDNELRLLDKGHTRADFLKVVQQLRTLDLPLSPTFIPFTPWTTRASYCDLLQVLASENLVESVSPIQLAIRLLIPAQSPLIKLPKVKTIVKEFDQKSLSYSWEHSDLGLKDLFNQVRQLVKTSTSQGMTRSQIFKAIWNLAHCLDTRHNEIIPPIPIQVSRATIPFLEEPWYC